MAEQFESARNRIKTDLLRRLIRTDENDAKEARRRTLKGLMRYAGLLVIGVLLVLVLSLIARSRVAHEYKVNWSLESSEEAYLGYEELGGAILKYGRDDISCISTGGDTLWTKAHEMKNPAVVKNGSYAAVYDRKANLIDICSRESCQGTVQTSLPIVKAAISQAGVVAVILEDPAANYIAFYDRTGTKLDVEIKTVLNGDGYPVDLDLSPNGQQLVVSYVNVGQGALENQIVFYNFDLSKDALNRIVGGFTQQDALTARVAFLGNVSAVAVADSKLEFYSLKNPLAPQLVKRFDVNSEIRSVVRNESFIGIVTDNEDDNAELDSILTVFDGGGKIIFQKEFTFPYTQIRFANDEIIMYNASECYIYRTSGKLRYSGTFESDIKRVVGCGSDGNYLFVGSSLVESVKLK